LQAAKLPPGERSGTIKEVRDMGTAACKQARGVSQNKGQVFKAGKRVVAGTKRVRVLKILHRTAKRGQVRGGWSGKQRKRVRKNNPVGVNRGAVREGSDRGTKKWRHG